MGVNGAINDHRGLCAKALQTYIHMHARANTRAHTHRHEDLSLNNRGMDDDTQQQQQQQHLCRRARSLVPAPRPLPSQTAAASLHVLNAGVRADISHRGLCGCTENVIFPASVEGYSLPGSLGSLVQWTGSGADATATSGGITSHLLPTWLRWDRDCCLI